MEEKLNLSVILPIKSAVVKDFDEFFDKAIKSLKSTFSKNPKNYSRIPNINIQENTQSKPSFLTKMKSAISETGKKVGSFIEEKIKPSNKSNPRYRRIGHLVLNNN